MGYFAKCTAAAMALFGCAVQCDAAIIISQYYDGAARDGISSRWIELANTGSATVNLSTGNYKLSLFSNANNTGWRTAGKTPDRTLTLNGSIPAGATFLVGRSDNATPTGAAGRSSGDGTRLDDNLVMAYSGNDSLVLWAGSSYAFSSVVDAFGLTDNTAADASFYRNANVLTGTNEDFDADDWTKITEDQAIAATAGTNAYVGYHQALAPTVHAPEPALLTGVAFAALAFLRRRAVPAHSGRI